jgi:hypothetical protein
MVWYCILFRPFPWQLFEDLTQVVLQDLSVPLIRNILLKTQKDVLIDICSDLGSDDLEKLKFLLKDVAGLSKLKTATIALELFNAIEHNKHVGLLNGRFLGECFELMGRTDLVRQLGITT